MVSSRCGPSDRSGFIDWETVACHSQLLIERRGRCRRGPVEGGAWLRQALLERVEETVNLNIHDCHTHYLRCAGIGVRSDFFCGEKVANNVKKRKKVIA